MSNTDQPEHVVTIERPFPLKSSPGIATLLAALAKAQAAFGEIEKSKTAVIQTRGGSRFSYRYSDLSQVLAAVRPALNANELTLLQPVSVRAGVVAVQSIIGHSSGEWLASQLELPSGDATDARALASIVTYARRYGLTALLALSPADESADDDAEAATSTRAEPPVPQEPTPATSAPREPVISAAQQKRLFTIARASGWSSDDVKRFLIVKGIGWSADIRRDEYDALIEILRRPPAPDTQEAF